MFGVSISNLVDVEQKSYKLSDYQSEIPRWCPGCGDNGILTSAQRLCREQQLPPEKTVFVSGIGCSSRLPHYMNTYGFHSLHGRALPVAEGIKIRRPDLNVFVNMGDGDCCSIGTAHWIHAIHYNINMVAMMHDNGIYGLTKKQQSPTSPKGTVSNTSPYGSVLDPINPISTTLGVANVSFVAQAVEWVPELLYNIIVEAFKHKGFSFIRILQRCPHYTPNLFDPLLNDPTKIILLEHENGMPISDAMKKIYKNVQQHDPMDMAGAQKFGAMTDNVPVGILYRNPNVPAYDELRKPRRAVTPEMKQSALEQEFDKFGVEPTAATGGTDGSEDQ